MATRLSLRPFQLAERAVISLYDGGVLSPAVLEHVLTAFAGLNIDWNNDAKARSVDGRSLREIVATTMMPGRSSRTATKDFASIIGHFESNAQAHGHLAVDDTGDENDAQEDEPAEDEALLDQLGGKSRSAKRPAAVVKRPSSSGLSTGFNPFVNARPPGSKK